MICGKLKNLLVCYLPTNRTETAGWTGEFIFPASETDLLEHPPAILAKPFRKISWANGRVKIFSIDPVSMMFFGLTDHV